MPLPGYGWIFPTSSHSANIGAGYFVKAGQRPLEASPQQTMRDFLRNPYVARVVGEAEPSATPKGYPLRTDFLTAPLAVPGLAMVGEAAGLVNPLTGEGIDFALELGELAAELIVAELRADRSAADLAEAFIRGLRLAPVVHQHRPSARSRLLQPGCSTDLCAPRIATRISSCC